MLVIAADEIPICPNCGKPMQVYSIGSTIDSTTWACKSCSTFNSRGDKVTITESVVTELKGDQALKASSGNWSQTTTGPTNLIPPKFRSTQSDEPTGLQPKSEWIKDRMFELTQAMERYSVANTPIPHEWIAELKQLITLL